MILAQYVAVACGGVYQRGRVGLGPVGRNLSGPRFSGSTGLWVKLGSGPACLIWGSWTKLMLDPWFKISTGQVRVGSRSVFFLNSGLFLAETGLFLFSLVRSGFRQVLGWSRSGVWTGRIFRGIVQKLIRTLVRPDSRVSLSWSEGLARIKPVRGRSTVWPGRIWPDRAFSIH